MQILFWVIIILLVLVVNYWWYNRRFNRLQKVAMEYGLSFEQKIPSLLGALFPGKVDSIQGNLGGHQIEIYDWQYWSNDNLLRSNALGGIPRGTSVNLDGNPMKFGPTNLTLGGSALFARVSEVHNLLEKIKNQNL